MTLRHMKIFLAVCDCGYNTTKAARALHMSQPAVSLAIREIEEYYGVRLFDRISRRLHITEAGESLREYAAHIIQLFDAMEKGLRNWERLGPLRIGASITIGAQFLPGYVQSFTALHPGAQIRATIGPSMLLEGKLLDNSLDFALMEGVPRSPVLNIEPYMEDHLTVICAANGPFQPGQKLTQAEFARQKFLLRESGSGTREEFERVIQSAGLRITPIWEAMSTTALVNGVISGLGISVLPYRMVQGPLARGLIIAVEVEGLSFCRKFNIVYHRDKYLTASAKEFLDICRNFEAQHPLPQYNDLH